MPRIRNTLANPNGTYPSVTTGTAAARPSVTTGKVAWYYATDTGQLSYSNGTSWVTVGPSTSSTPTIGELFIDTWVTPGVSGALSALDGASVGLFTAPFPLTIQQIAFTSWSNTLSTDVTNFRTLTLRKYRAGANLGDIAAKSTSVEAWTLRTPWTFDAVTFDSTLRQFAQYDILGLFVSHTGTPAADPTGVRMTVRYEPL